MSSLAGIPTQESRESGRSVRVIREGVVGAVAPRQLGLHPKTNVLKAFSINTHVHQLYAVLRYSILIENLRYSKANRSG